MLGLKSVRTSVTFELHVPLISTVDKLKKNCFSSLQHFLQRAKLLQNQQQNGEGKSLSTPAMLHLDPTQTWPPRSRFSLLSSWFQSLQTPSIKSPPICSLLSGFSLMREPGGVAKTGQQLWGQKSSPAPLEQMSQTWISPWSTPRWPYPAFKAHLKGPEPSLSLQARRWEMQCEVKSTELVSSPGLESQLCN